VTLGRSRTSCNIDVTPGTLTATDTCIGYHVTRFEASRNVILYTRYVSTCLEAGCGRGRATKIQTKAIRCRACYYSTMLNAHRVTSMADTDIDAVRKHKKAEYAKQYRLKRKLLLQQEASKDIYMIRYFQP
jgi:quinol monooxygenase YgiN